MENGRRTTAVHRLAIKCQPVTTNAGGAAGPWPGRAPLSWPTAVLRAIGAAIWLSAAVAAAGQPATRSAARQAPVSFYMAGDKRVELRLSRRFFAVRLPAADRGALLARVNDSGVLQAESSALLDRYGLLLLRRATNSRDEDVWQLLAAVSGDPAAIPVFESDGVLRVLVDDFALQLEANAPLSVSDSLLADYPQASFVASNDIAGRYQVSFPGSSAAEGLSLINRMAISTHVRFASPNFVMVYPRDRAQWPQSPGSGRHSSREVSAGNVDQGSPWSLHPLARANAQSCEGSPDDPMLGEQWSLGTATPGNGGISATEAWAVTSGSPDIVIAVIDDGIDVGHPDLAGKIVGQYDAVSDDDDATPAHPWDGHGTAAAGIAAASTDNCVGIAGIAWRSRIYAVRVFDSSKDSRQTTPATLEKGIRRAIDAGARVFSIGLSGGDPQPQLEMAIDDAIAAGAVLVFSAGNDNRAVNYPARLSRQKTLIAVAATNRRDELKRPNAAPDGEPWGSNFGPEITVAAPGVHILTTDIVGSGGFDDSDDYYPYFGGTSASVPMVAGAAALLLSLKPAATPDQIRDWIQCGADEVGAPDFAVRRLNVKRSLDAAMAGCPGSDRRGRPAGAGR